MYFNRFQVTLKSKSAITCSISGPCVTNAQAAKLLNITGKTNVIETNSPQITKCSIHTIIFSFNTLYVKILHLTVIY